MKVKLTFESDTSWTTTKIIDVQDNVSEEDIESMFPIVLNVQYDKDNCFYEVVGKGHIYTLDEIMSYTE